MRMTSDIFGKLESIRQNYAPRAIMFGWVLEWHNRGRRRINQTKIGWL